ncbi:uncharacterized protein LOC119099160 [Pollicipes pollicipes]|uniref:uncharacterized protein LOC119099160 n=1 Tax=Pollicipes pollicipes TaxID=41117 RepID=UPI001884BCAE|nr:uncharacterized protein LOC119099160 [Pollicipes pollicipes]
MGFQERGEEPREYQKVQMLLKSRHGGDPHEFEFWKTDRLCSQPTPARPPSVLFEPRLLLADDFAGGPVDVLIGADQLYSVLLWNQISLATNLRAIETVFGYVIHGQEGGTVNPQPVRYAYRCCRQMGNVEQMWTLDSVGLTDPVLKETSSSKPTWNEEDHRYEMGLLWTSDERPVSNQHATSIRTRRMESRLDPAQHSEYGSHIDSLLQSSVIETSSKEDDLHSPGEIPRLRTRAL